ncbi:MAG TPA: DUF4089 domain-containing protein [Leptolyngbyaceae cyanobacterium]
MTEPHQAFPFDSEAYVDQMSAFIRLPIPAELRAGVIENVERIWKVAQPVIEFHLPDDLEAAPTFEP